MPVNSPMIEIEYVEPAEPDPVASESEPTEADRQEAEATRIQAMSEGVSTNRTLEFLGRRFRIADKIGLMPTLKFAYLSALGLDTESEDPQEQMQAMSAIYTMIAEVVHPDDWGAFEAHATSEHADMEDLLAAIGAAMEAATARPSQPRSGSSRSRHSTGHLSTPGPSAKAAALGLVPVADLLE